MSNRTKHPGENNVTAAKDSAPARRSDLADKKAANHRITTNKRKGPTGPRTILGKKISSKNAIKRGIYSKLTLLKDECPAELKSLTEGLRSALQPSNNLEELLFDEIVTNRWRLRRALLAEVGEITIHAEFLEFDRRLKQQREAHDLTIPPQPAPGEIYGPAPTGLIRNIDNPVVLEHCLQSLIELQNGIDANGFDGEHDLPLLVLIYGDLHEDLFRPTLHDEYSACVAHEEATKFGAHPERDECKRRFLKKLVAEINDLQRYRSLEPRRVRVEIERQRVPDSPAFERVYRAETHLGRCFDRTLSQYMRAQQIRRGQRLPPQMDVTIK